MKSLILAIALTLVTTACANRLSNDAWQNQVAAKVQEWHLQPINSITTFALDSWTSLGEHYLIIRTSPFKPYLLELKARCPSLNFANNLLTKQAMSSSLSARFDSVIPGNSPDIPCQINKIYPLTKEQEKALTSLDN
ncbi:MAG: DUF6491 family protein [Shewanella sp.]|nr:DUF6491 family protein [Shewanella sp.]MCF1459548.1 DUF6491 family protein [Shewanella sp.]